MLQVGQCNISFSFIKPLLKIHPFWHFIKTKIKFLNLSNATDNINIQKTNLQQFVSINAKILTQHIAPSRENETRNLFR